MEAPHLDEWVAAELIEPGQAEAIRRYEAARAAEGSVLPDRQPRETSAAAEVKGSQGARAAAVAAVVGTNVLWGERTVFARIAVPAVAAVVMLGAGAAVPRRADAATSRLAAMLWLLGIAAIAATVAIGLDQTVGWNGWTITLISGLVVVTTALSLAPLRREPHMVLAVAGGVSSVVLGTVGQYEHASAGQFGAALVAVGLALMLFGWAGVLVSTGTAYVVGGAVAFVGTEMLGEEGRRWPVLVGCVIAALILAAFVAGRHRALLVTGLVYALVFLTQAIVLATDSGQGGAGRLGTVTVLGAFGVGAVLLALAVNAIRRHDDPARP